MTAVLVLGLAAVVTWGLRILFISLVPAARLPEHVQAALGDVAPAVMAALVVGSLTHGRGVAGLVPSDVAAAVLAAAVAWWTRNLGLTVAVGVVAAGLLRLL
jgi:branched-subunit amino acid transport protein